jgi:hypothetical protein
MMICREELAKAPKRRRAPRKTVPFLLGALLLFGAFARILHGDVLRRCA